MKYALDVAWRRVNFDKYFPSFFLYLFIFIYSFFNVDNYRTNTVYNKKQQ